MGAAPPGATLAGVRNELLAISYELTSHTRGDTEYLVV